MQKIAYRDMTGEQLAAEREKSHRLGAIGYWFSYKGQTVTVVWPKTGDTWLAQIDGFNVSEQGNPTISLIVYDNGIVTHIWWLPAQDVIDAIEGDKRVVLT